MGLRLGEGTGAVLAIPLLRAAAATMTYMVALKDIANGSDPITSK
jgi:nicotinate-nucleotide--dimethylbenzimidazole phosphoribosyltransferase